ncbi:hypothetical protein L596_020366 [Steinernema carpocapsae]|uniref:Peptidase M28 domain-containing protein n=1 Tax=Steinernema carpocapsae TaxID=34508 RepID=A0A4U5MU35_STECR|nr:hypothetical protein L596_020366 [Steinernema carpocapsae]
MDWKVSEVIFQYAKKVSDVRYVEYDVLLGYPNYSNPNHMTILNSDGSVFYKNKGKSPVILPKEQGAPGANIQWVAYSGQGKVAGEVVYCHYGRPVDFKVLEKEGIDLKGKIALLRYSNGFRGDKVREAQIRDAVGAILYSDPAEVAKDGVNHVYPNTDWLPSGGVQRGTLKLIAGDALTPLYPSLDDLYPERTIKDAKNIHVLPSIPVIPLSYSDAWHLMSRMKGPNVPAEWQGGINVTYKLGPGLKDGRKVEIDVKSLIEKRKVKNVIGYIRGSEESDRYVILGNHFDAWVYGSIDPNSGTAVLTEVARSMRQTMQETGWRPKRTIMFCSWDAEEHGLIGSTEFVEEFANILRDRAVVYLNVDNLNSNNSLYANTVPTMYRVAFETAKKVRNPMRSEMEAGRKTTYDTWRHYFPNTFSYLPDSPGMGSPTGSSDHASFLNFIGVPVIDFTYRNFSWREYPLYHTLYETPFVNEHIFDHNKLSVHRAVGQYWALLTKEFADQPVIPVNVTVYAQAISLDYVPQLVKIVKQLANKHDEAKDAVKQVQNLVKDGQRFLSKAASFEQRIPRAFHSSSVLQRSKINDRLMAIDRCFINPRGIPDEPMSRHVIFSISSEDTYSASVFAGVYKMVRRLEAAKTSEEREQAGRNLAYQISIVQYSVKCAVNTLSDRI